MALKEPYQAGAIFPPGMFTRLPDLLANSPATMIRAPSRELTRQDPTPTSSHRANHHASPLRSNNFRSREKAICFVDPVVLLPLDTRRGFRSIDWSKRR